MTAAVQHVPGAHAVKGVADGVLDTVGSVSPHARRVAAYAGVGLLGVAGVVEWPVAAAGAAVVWLTQQRPKETEAEAGHKASNGSRAKTTTEATKSARTQSSSAAAEKAEAPFKASTARTTSTRSRTGGRQA
jgi:hypothetical protein